MKKHFVIILLLMISCISGHAYLVTGRAVSEMREPVIGATCLMYSLPDSVFSSGTATDAEGNFVLSTEAKFSILKITSLGFDGVQISVDIPDGLSQSQQYSLGEINMHPVSTELAEINVKGRKPQLRIKNGILNYDIDEMLKHNSYTSAHGLLSQLPLLVSEDGKSLKLAGAPNGSQIYINGRKPTMSQKDIIEYLLSLPAKQIQDVDIVYLPGPEWGSSMSVINVKVRRQRNYSLTGRLNADYSHSTGNTFNPSGTMIWSVPKASVHLMYYYNLNDEHSEVNQTGIHTLDEEAYSVANSSFRQTRSHYHYAYGNVRYEPDANNRFEVFYHGRFTPSFRKLSHTLSDLFAEENMAIHREGQTNSAGLLYNFKDMLSLYATWSGSRSQSSQTIVGTEASAYLDEMKLETDVHSNSVSANFDFNHLLPKGWKLNYGVLCSYDERKSCQTYLGFAQDFNFNYNYKDNSFRVGGYAGVSKELIKSKLYVSPSLSVLHSKVGEDRRTGFYPFMQATYYVSPAHILQLSIQTSKETPTLYQLTPNASFTDTYSISVGNPLLKQGRVNVGQLIYLLKNKYVVRLSAVHKRNVIADIPYQSPYMLRLISQPMNVAHWDAFALGWSVPVQAGIYSMNLDGEISHIDAKWDWHEINIDKGNWEFFVSSSNLFKILRNPYLTGHLNLSYATPKYGSGVIRASHYFKANAGFSLSLFNDAMSIRAFIYDIFNGGTRRYHRITVADQNIGTYYPDCGRTFTIAIGYAFKGYRNRNVRQIDTSAVGD